METKVKKREWVKDAAIIFLAVLLVLTFFSNTIMNRSLPEVATAAVTEGSIVSKVRGSGTVTANGKQQVKAKETRTIRAVMIKTGQEVNAGDVLFVLGEGDETALEQAKETLRNLQYSYQRSAVSLPSFDSSGYDRSVSNAERRLAAAEKAEADARYAFEKIWPETSSSEYRTVSQELALVEAELQKTIAERDAAQEAFDNRYNIAVAKVEEAQKKFDAVYAQYYGKDDHGQDDAISFEVDDDYPQAPVDVTGGDTGSSGDEEIVVIEDGVGNAIYENSAVPFASNGDVESGIFEYPKVQEAWDELQAAETRLALLNEDNDDYLVALKNKVTELETRYEMLKRHRDEIMPASAIPAKEAWEEALELLEDAQADYEDALASRDYARESFNRSVASSYIDMQQTAEEIRLQQEKIKSLAGDEENVVTATVSGTIDTIDCTAGDTVVKDGLMCTIEVPDMGHTLSFSVTNDQAQRLRIGDTATVSNYYWGSSVTATLTSIRTDPKNPQNGKILTFDLTGDVTTGSELTISVGQKSANYDTVVPNSAIKSDTNGSFVLAVSVKSSPLGNRYTARRVSVEVLASDDNNSAVIADLANGDFVITTSSAPIRSGDMVRMADN